MLKKRTKDRNDLHNVINTNGIESLLVLYQEDNGTFFKRPISTISKIYITLGHIHSKQQSPKVLIQDTSYRQI